MERPTLEGEIRTLQSLIRRMKASVSDFRTICGSGWDSGALQEAALREGLEATDGQAEAEVHLCADANFKESSTTPARVIGVIAREATCDTLPLYATRPARRYVTLRDWVSGWFPRHPMISRLLVSSAVQERYSSNRWPNHSEWIFVRDPAVLAPRGGMADSVKYLLVTLGGSGAFPIMPATVASALMLPFGLAFHAWFGAAASAWIWGGICLLATIGCLALEKWAARWFLAEDPKEFVLDEVAGLALAWAMLPMSSSWGGVVWAFVLFRVFDIFKWGVDWVEKVPFRGRVVWDDLLAGLYAGAIVWLAIFMA
jgi:phosphatidylglycerophosphatase A